jgi:hypothetical protein
VGPPVVAAAVVMPPFVEPLTVLPKGPPLVAAPVVLAALPAAEVITALVVTLPLVPLVPLFPLAAFIDVSGDVVVPSAPESSEAWEGGLSASSAEHPRTPTQTKAENRTRRIFSF